MSNVSTPDIIKAAAIIINKDHKLLVVRKSGSDIWISVGGKPEQGETIEQALVREVKEEIQTDIIGKPILYHTSPVEPAAGKDSKTIKIFSFLAQISETPQLNPEDQIEEYIWLSKNDFESGKYKLGSVLEKFVIPKLISESLVR